MIHHGRDRSNRSARKRVLPLLAAALFLAGCHDGHPPSPQDLTPVKQLQAHVCGFHFYNGAMGRQVEAHHYCSHLGDEVLQCVIYDGTGKGARLIGVEYIISERLFKTLNEEERKLWHSHSYEVKGGLLTAPLLPPSAEKGLMKTLVSTYGKTFHTWQVDRGDALPLGVPQLMMGFTAPGQIRPELLQKRDAKYGVSTEEIIRDRADIPTPQKAPGADAWERGQTLQLQAVETKPGQ